MSSSTCGEKGRGTMGNARRTVVIDREIDIILVPFGSQLYERMKIFREELLWSPIGLRMGQSDIHEEESRVHIAPVERSSAGVVPVLLQPISAYYVKLRQMAVAKKEQGTGLGRRLVSFAEQTAKQIGFKEIELDARIKAVGFYEKLGFSSEGPEYISLTACKKMRK